MSMSVGGHLFDKRKCNDCGKVCVYPVMLWDIDVGKKRIMLCTECAKLLSRMLKGLHDYDKET